VSGTPGGWEVPDPSRQGSVGKELGLRVLGASVDEYANAVDLQVVVLQERARAALAARYGAGALQATATLVPVD
jgi:hypothetical protein